MQSVTSIFSKSRFRIFFHILLLLVLIFSFKTSGIKKINVLENGFLNFDAAWYNDVKDHGYVFKVDSQSNSGFYPAFPFVWRISHFSPIAISALNAIIFFFAFYLLDRNFNFNVRESFLMLSIPSLIFNFIPYSEALLFLFAVIFLIGLSKGN